MYEAYINKIEDVGNLRNLKPGTIRTYKNNVKIDKKLATRD